eukprot:TRINITY_DN96777_c0_g1_i1.p1 TRINITY_DN96777_c0_g1~~TRINITY_DN96777_c0_g1_i1.p1  ORF type:complete len:125 (-),score=7.09 TRINITY_DN96777_c0_g1_i1:58-432(-)
MRTMLTLDTDVAAKARKGAARLGKPFKEVVNHALRIGLDEVLTPPVAKRYQTQPRPVGLRDGLNYDDIAGLLAVSEGEKHRSFSLTPTFRSTRKTASPNTTRSSARGGTPSSAAPNRSLSAGRC